MKENKLIIFEIIVLISIILLAIYWYVSDKGELEPLIILLTIILSFIEIFRRYDKGSNSKEEIIPNLPVSACLIAQRSGDNAYESAKVQIFIDGSADITGPAKLEVETLRSWKFKSAQAGTHLNEWYVVEHRLLVGKSESEVVSKNVGVARKAESFAIEVDLSTDEIIKGKFHEEFTGAIAYHLKFSIHLKGYQPEEMYFIAFLYGGWAPVTTESGPSKNELIVQLSDIDQLIESVGDGAHVSVPHLRDIQKYKENIIRAIEKN